jgi:serine/threonine protein kinase
LGEWSVHEREPTQERLDDDPSKRAQTTIEFDHFFPEFGKPKPLSEWIINIKMDDAPVLGKGAQGEVKVYKDEKGQRHAVKCITIGRGLQKRFEREIDLLAKLKHPCIIAFEGYTPRDRRGQAMIMTEFMPNGTLEENIYSQKPNEPPRLTSPTKLARIVSGIVLGMKFMHSKKAIHRDLKPSNLLLDSSWRVRITDFGVSRFATGADTLTGGVGTIHYMAPECFAGGDLTDKVDVYSFGLILYEIVVGKPVFSRGESPAAVIALIRRGDRADIPTTVSQEMQRMIDRCWDNDPNVRPWFGEILLDLKRIKFEILPGVKSEKILMFVTEIETWEKKQELAVQESTLTMPNQPVADGEQTA